MLPRSRAARWGAGVAALAVAAAAAGAIAWAASDRSAEVEVAEPLPGSSPVASAGPALPPADPAAPLPTAAGVDAALAGPLGDPALGGDVRVSILDAATGEPLVARQAQAGATPASTAKLLTAAAALVTLDPETRLRTGVAPGAAAGEYVLVGGGDATLTTAPSAAGSYPASASLAELAQRTAAALAPQGLSQITLRYDARLFAPPTAAPSWPPGYLASGVVGPVTALSADQGRVAPDRDARVADPSLEAARRFAQALATAGVAVAGEPTAVDAATPAAKPAAFVASVESAPVSALGGADARRLRQRPGGGARPPVGGGHRRDGGLRGGSPRDRDGAGRPRPRCHRALAARRERAGHRLARRARVDHGAARPGVRPSGPAAADRPRRDGRRRLQRHLGRPLRHGRHGQRRRPRAGQDRAR